MKLPVLVAILSGLVAQACTPALDWREVRPEGSGAVALFPCKPSHHARMVALAGSEVRLTVTACRAGSTIFGLAFADVVDPGRVGPALAELTESAVENLSGRAEPPSSLNVTGMTPNPAAARIKLSGRRPDGAAVEEEIAVFAKGTRIYQATVLASSLDREVVDTFLDALKLE